jgi:hypothetical protein
MEILASVLAFPALFAGVMMLAVLAYGMGSLAGSPAWLRLSEKALLYAILLTFLFLTYTFSLSAALSISYLYFIWVFTALFGCTSFLIPKWIVQLLGLRVRWFARSIAAFGYAFVLLTFSALVIKQLPLSASIPKPAILIVAFVSLSLFAFPRLVRSTESE